jgi:hypothetical protein
MIIRANEGVPAGKNVVVATILLRHFYNPELLVGKKDQNRWKILLLFIIIIIILVVVFLNYYK